MILHLTEEETTESGAYVIYFVGGRVGIRGHAYHRGEEYTAKPILVAELAAKSGFILDELEAAAEAYLRENTAPSLNPYSKMVTYLTTKISVATQREGDYWEGRADALRELLAEAEEWSEEEDTF